MGLLVQLVATDETTQKMIQEHEVLFQNDQSILSDIRCSIEEMSRRLEEVEEMEKKGIIDFGCEEDEITMQVANCGIVRENDSDDEEEQEEWRIYQESLVKEVDVEEELDLGDSLESMFDDEVEVEVDKKVLSWEDEFLGELDGLS
ncbi:hypothetical protein HanIR_Chr14g0686231 [Helianthus annuus]|nr:hypothetical protein HanIR_Chr14g0686231 [Helianthus annuus]